MAADRYARPIGVHATADGTPAEGQPGTRPSGGEQITALLLVAAAFGIFILVSPFLIPIGDMTFRSVDNSLLSDSHAAHRGRARELGRNDGRTAGRGGLRRCSTRMSSRAPRRAPSAGWHPAQLRVRRACRAACSGRSGRKFKRIKEPPYKEALIGIDKKWGDLETWRLIKRESAPYTLSYYLAAVDMRYRLRRRHPGPARRPADLRQPVHPHVVAEPADHRAVHRARLTRSPI